MPPKFMMPKTGIPFKPTKSSKTLVREALSGAGPGVRKPGTKAADAVTAGVGDGAGFLSNWKEAMLTGGSMIGVPGAVITGAAALGEIARPHLEKLPNSSSGRGAGRASFRDSNNNNVENNSNLVRPTGSGMSGALPADYKSTEQQAFNEAAIHTGRKNREEQLKNGGVPGQLPASAGPVRPTRNIETVNPKGVVQRGTQTSPRSMTMDDANKLLTGGYKVENPYSSNQLPTTASSPYAGKSNAQIYNPDTLHQHDSDVDYVSLSKNLDEDKSGVAPYERGKNMKADYKQMDVNPGESVPEEKINWANRTMADNSDEKVRRRAAMLDDAVDADGNPLGIMQRMRNQEAIQGRMYAGGKHWQRNKNAGQEGENDFVEISAGQSRARSNYTKTADEVFANHLGKAKEAVASGDIPNLPKDAPAPLPDSVPSNTSMDKSPFDTEDLMQMQPSESITGDNKPYTSLVNKNLF